MRTDQRACHLRIAMPAFMSPSTDPTFTPRQEFIREQQRTLHSFCLLALSSSNSVRLSAFPPPVVTALQRLFERTGVITSFHSNSPLDLCEFVLDGKPWANPKSVNSEKLLIDIISTLYQNGYTFLSTIDYGRERDDRVAMVFSKPIPQSDLSVRSISPQLGRPGSAASQRTVSGSVAFALSFISSTLLRVISPPRYCTPAILQAIRGSWPRGVVSERKVGDASYEFKLKGYKWFQEDTFAEDSLRHIISILSSLDSHSFSLLTSLTLSGSSRVKDLWIFLGTVPSGEELDSRGSPVPSLTPGIDSNRAPNIIHRRMATAPVSPYPNSTAVKMHTRAATENNLIHGGISTRVVPNQTGNASPVEGCRITLPSIISSDLENMTGIGTAATVASRRGLEHSQVYDVIHESRDESEDGAEWSTPITPGFRRRSTSPPRHPLRPVSTRSKTPPLLTSSPTSDQQYATFPRVQTQNHNGPSGASGPLLNSGVFRDSVSADIPIKWVSGDQGVRDERPRTVSSSDDFSVRDKPTDGVDARHVPGIASRVPLPDVAHSNEGIRKSEKGFVGMIAPPSSPSSASPQSKDSRSEMSPNGQNGQNGWVLVNVESQKPSTPGVSPPATKTDKKGQARKRKSIFSFFPRFFSRS